MICARPALLLIAALAGGAPSAGAAEAQARGSGLERYLAAVDAAEAGFDAACERARAETAPPGRVWLRLGRQGLEIVPADAEGAAAAAFWADRALGARSAAAALYGRAAGAGLKAAPVMIETGIEGGVAVHDGKAMSLGDVCDALRRLVAAMGDGAIGDADPFAAARDRAAAPERLALAIGGRTEATLSAALPDGATARGPDGVAAEIVATDEGPRLALEAGADAAPGDAAARIYAPDDPFRPVETVEITILPGAAEATASTSAAIAPDGRIDGIVAGGDAAELTLDVERAGRVRFTSGGGADMAAVLLSESGAVVAADDDSGEGYGFSFSAELAPGRYTLKLTHCCGGGGAFSLTTSSQ